MQRFDRTVRNAALALLTLTGAPALAQSGPWLSDPLRPVQWQLDTVGAAVSAFVSDNQPCSPGWCGGGSSPGGWGF